VNAARGELKSAAANNALSTVWLTPLAVQDAAPTETVVLEAPKGDPIEWDGRDLFGEYGVRGSLDDHRIYGKVLTPTELASVANQQPRAWYRMPA
jgi:hypothetical protein